MIQYVCTEYADWKDPKDFDFNVAKGTVCGIFATRKEAEDRLWKMINSPLYSAFCRHCVEKPDGWIVDVDNFLHVELTIHERNVDY